MITLLATINPGSAFFGFVFFLGIYFIPTIIAATRHHRSVLAIGVINLSLGWTVIGWFWALIWALANHGNNNQSVVVQQTVVNSMPPAPAPGQPPASFVQPSAPLQQPVPVQQVPSTGVTVTSIVPKDTNT